MDTPDMSHTKRTPIVRTTRLQPSARALELFDQLEKARRQRRAATCIIGDSPAGYCSSECAACRTWYDLHNKLHEELGLKPWEWLCLPQGSLPDSSTEAKWGPRSAGIGDRNQARQFMTWHYEPTFTARNSPVSSSRSTSFIIIRRCTVLSAISRTSAFTSFASMMTNASAEKSAATRRAYEAHFRIFAVVPGERR
jgi:hypothetical protein